MEKDNESLREVVKFVVAEQMLLAQGTTDFEVEYEALVNLVGEKFDLAVPEEMPECEFIVRREEKYYVLIGKREEAINYFLFNYIADLFREYESGLDLYQDLLKKLLIEFHEILAGERDWAAGIQLYIKFEQDIVGHAEFQVKIQEFVSRLFKNSLKVGDDITEYIDTAKPFEGTLIWDALISVSVCNNEKYYLKDVDLYSEEFGILFAIGCYFVVLSDQVEFLCRASQYYGI